MPGSRLRLAVTVDTDGAPRLSVDAFLVDAMRQKLAMASLYQFEQVTLPQQPGRYRVVMEVQPGWLASGAYTFDVTTSVVNSNWDHYVDDAASFEVVSSNPGPAPGTSARTTAMARSRCRLAVGRRLPCWPAKPGSMPPVSRGRLSERAGRVAATGQSVSHVRLAAALTARQVGEPAGGFDTVFAGAHFFQPPYAVHVCSNCGLYFKTDDVDRRVAGRLLRRARRRGIRRRGGLSDRPRPASASRARCAMAAACWTLAAARAAS